MKNITIFIVLIFYSSTLLSQEDKQDKLYIYINNKSFWPAMLGYKAVIGIKSKEREFSHDNYYFKISFNDLDHQSLYSLGTTINIDSLDYIKNPVKYLENLSVCEVHNKLSLYKQVFIITEIPKSKLDKEEDKSKKYIMWSAQYAGTNKDVTWVNPTNKPLIEN